MIQTIPLSSDDLSFTLESLFYRNFKISSVELTHELWNQHSMELMKMVTSQYYKKDPSSAGLSYEQLYQYFKDEYDAIFTTDDSYIQAFLFFDEKGKIVGTFMFRDAYMYVQNHRKILVGMKPTESFYDYYLQFCVIADSYFSKFNVKKGDCTYGTNLAFSADFLESLGSAKDVLRVLIAEFIDMAQWWRNLQAKTGKYQYSMWVQYRKSLILTTQRLFNCLGDDDFTSQTADGTGIVEGKLFFVKSRTREEELKLWANASKL